jgi:hypothetical protein
MPFPHPDFSFARLLKTAMFSSFPMWSVMAHPTSRIARLWKSRVEQRLLTLNNGGRLISKW